MKTTDAIKYYRIKAGLTQEELGKKLGLQKSAIAKYESGRVENIKRSVLDKMADVLGCSPLDLLGIDAPAPHPVRIPVYGRVAAGIPMEAIQEIIDWEEIASAMASDGEYFALQIHGDSMEPKISNGDVVIVRKQETADDGDLVIALVNGNDAVCKRLKKYDNGTLALISTNPAYDPMYFTKGEIDNTPVRILGKVKELRAKF